LLIVGSEEIVQLDAGVDAELSRVVPDAAPDRCATTAQVLSLRCLQCMEALSEFCHEGTFARLVARSFKRPL
jgi:hypothetical protein